MTQPPPLPESSRQPPPLPLATRPPPLPPHNPYATPLPPHNPYAAPLAPVDEAPDEELELADRGARLGAVVLDYVFVFAAAMLMAVLLPVMRGMGEAAMLIVVLVVVGAFLGLIGYNLVLLHRYGQTLGKRIVGIRIVRIDGSRCELWRIIVLRIIPVGLLGAIPLVGWIVSLVDALMIFGDERRCLHDLFAETMVVKV